MEKEDKERQNMTQHDEDIGGCLDTCEAIYLIVHALRSTPIAIAWEWSLKYGQTPTSATHKLSLLPARNCVHQCDRFRFIVAAASSLTAPRFSYRRNGHYARPM